MKIYTKRGDAGETSLFDGAAASKADVRVRAYGDVDELNAMMGVARCELQDHPTLASIDATLALVQEDLFALGAVLADPRRDASRDAKDWTAKVDFGAERIAALERRIDEWDLELPALTHFILPGGSRAASALHAGRTVARRAERSVVALAEAGGGTPECVVYLNRLSDLLFMAARAANHWLGVADVPWRP